ncbi:kinase-like domain-containing protein [Hyaloscypha sp. PMI_1271]|nr:kinase-like domain-containing protein [Hyaloscypha sp. PMI_1271]
MVEPALALAIDACVNDSVAIVWRIGKKVKEIIFFKKRCLGLYDHAELLRRILERNKSEINNFETLVQFTKCLTDIEQFVDGCQKSHTLGGITVEVLFKHRYQRLMRDLAAAKDVFALESSSEVLHREFVNGEEAKTQLSAISSSISNIEKSVDELRKANQESERLKKLPNMAIPTSQFPSVYSDLTITFTDTEHNRGKSHIEGIGDVVCYEIEPSKLSYATIQVYQKLQSGAFIQHYHGISQNGNRLYAVMEDLDNFDTLADMYQDASRFFSLEERLVLAQDLSRTVAWYHRGEVILKSISDGSIVLKKSTKGGYRCFLKGTEKARSMYEPSSLGDFDVRYEAPEYHHFGLADDTHSSYTDIWGLGTAIWQIISGKFPWDTTRPVLAGHPGNSDILRVRSALSSGKLPGNLELDSLPAAIKDLVADCWHPDPMLRPPAFSIFRTLQDLSVSISSPGINISAILPASIHPVPADSILGETLKKAWAMICESRKAHQGKGKLNEEELVTLLSDEVPWTSLRYFVVGAVIWWDLAAKYPENILRAERTSCQLGTEEWRAYSALQFLQSAAIGGYQEAFLEMYRAHAWLARELKARVPSLKSELPIR